MERLLWAIGVLLVLLSVAAIAIYGWHGQWAAVGFAIMSAALGKFVLGLVEMVLLPLSMPAIAFAKRGRSFLSLCFMMVASLARGAACSAFCVAILMYLVRTPGPPSWMTIPLAYCVAAAPFNWAAQRASEDHPPSTEIIAVTLGVPVSGILLSSGVSMLLSIAPLAALFLISALVHVVWWHSVGMWRARNEAILEGSM